ncbi:hypothetical protein MW887_009231 [Aspergillus wentii]|nr:hypothetical protein MW887_009231 [Aspergillus wentii]
MAYNAISQADLEVASNATDSDGSRSPSPKHGFQQLPLDVDHMGGGSFLETARTAEDSSMSGFGSMIRSMTSASYEMVEEDDYEEVMADHPNRRSDNATSLRRVPPLDTTAKLAPSPEPPLRTPISDQPVPLSHPIPDLQSLQGAYLGNVERLERSAERMSSTTTDIESEIRKLDLEQKKRSTSSASNHSGMSPTVSTPQSATRLRSGSASRLAQVSEHGQEHDEYGHAAYPSSAAHILPPPPAAHAQGDSVPYGYQYDGGDEIERPASAASNDTYQQAKILFTDFDGVHYIPQEQASDLVRQISLTRSPVDTASGSHEQPPAGENMVYYPAPVPRMLNLPPRLSQKPISEREKRRTQILKSMASGNAKHSLSGPDRDDASDPRRSKQSTDMPPQLRASAFFEQPRTSLDIEIKDASAVATLDSILDASAHAPVTAFTDHPFAGHAGSEVYRSSKHKASSNYLSKQTEAEVAEAHEGAALHSGTNDEDGLDHPHMSEEEALALEKEEEEKSNYTGPPNTLMAELEFRKHELQHRRRTAANTIGLHSTLLELEAVAQKQSEHRRQRPVTLAWEGPDGHRHDDEEDDDVPLAMLFPEKVNLAADTRPLGLMEKKQLEDSEPLSSRRARLRGEAPPVQPPVFQRSGTMHSQGVLAPTEADSEDEGETLGQRLKRLRTQGESSVAESDFTREVLAEFRNMHADEEKKEEAPHEEEESLGALRARLQRETKKTQRSTHSRVPSARRSIADMSQMRPSTLGRQSSQYGTLPHGGSAESRMSMYQYPSNLGHAAPVGYPQYPEYGMQNPYGQGMVYPTTNTLYSDAKLGMNHLSYAMPNSLHSKLTKPPVELGQREVIDRWRQSIR